MIDEIWAREFAKDWIESWNSHDLERILTHYADDFEMSSPFIVQLMNEPGGTLKGKAAVGNYWRIGLAKSPGLKFVLSSVLTGANSVTILYTNHRAQLVAEVFIFNEEGKAIESFSHYSDRQEL